jgi:F0F1-type ATP synthase assembly protein I
MAGGRDDEDEKQMTGGAPRQTSGETLRMIGALSTVGLSFVFAIAIGFAAGYMLDRWLGTHWIWLPGFLLGIAAAVINVYRTATRYIK